MSEPFVFDPRHPLCKTPFGAVPCGGEVLFHCRPLAVEAFTHCALVVQMEFAGTEREIEMTLTGQEGDRSCFSLAFPAPAEPDLLWYHFRFWREDRSGCDLDKTGYRSDGQILAWQLTVYQENHTPAWFGKGVTYQIFPDRFCRLELPDPAGMIGGRWVHENWDEHPEWRPDARGEIWNRDFFGGSLKGVASRLDYLAELGVDTIYFCPIFESASNHRYNTADYMRIDPMLGTEEDFRQLCAQAKERGIRVILDGVFNHVGSQSRYFNDDGFYPTLGAAQSQDSPYCNWFWFHPWPSDYDSWWGIKTLPAVREDNPDYINYIIEDPDSVVRHWLKAGASGWRLDVADELPDCFIEKIRAAMGETDPEALLIGEVWEDASTKIAYSQRRRYLLGSELHGVMNYPFRNALLAYLQGADADYFRETMETLRENYPKEAFYSLMNFLGTHDTPRVLTVLGGGQAPASREERAAFRLSPTQLERGLALVKLAALVLFTFPGSPTVYYGDEAGLEGWEDPLNRGTYPWGRENQDLLAHFSRLGRLRHQYEALRQGDFRWAYTAGGLLAYTRTWEDVTLATVTNRDPEETVFSMPWSAHEATDLLTGRVYHSADGWLRLPLAGRSGVLLV